MRAAPSILRSLLLLGLAAAVSPVSAADPPPAPANERLVRSAGLTTDGPALLDFFRKRTHADTGPNQVAILIRQLGSPKVDERDRAVAELVSLGTVAVPLLRQAVKDPDEHLVLANARRCLQLIEGTSGSALVEAVARLVAVRKPAGAAEVLLAYLPFADNDSAVEEVQAALAALAVRDGRPDPALLAGLDDPLPIRRSVSAVALCRGGGLAQVPRVRPLLRDAKPTVRLHAASALAALKEADAVEALIELVGQLPAEQGKEADHFLRQVAGARAPTERPDKEEAARHRCRDAWAAWWRAADGPHLLAFFRKRTLTNADREQILALIRQLADESFEVREKATAELQARRDLAAPLLRQAARSSDPEVARRAANCLKQAEPEKAEALTPVVAARLLAFRKPDGALAALLDFLPFAENETVADAVREALAVLAGRDRRPDPALLAALRDPAAERRAAAAELLCRLGVSEARAQVRLLLKDGDARARHRAALALVAAGDRDGVPVLIGLLTELPPAQALQTEDLLRRLAGETAPRVSLGVDADSRQRSSIAWTAWWSAHGAKLALGPTPPTQEETERKP
jgi:HEAT repeat protein